MDYVNLELMVKKSAKKHEPDINEIATRIVKESTSEDNLRDRQSQKPKNPKSKLAQSKTQ